MSFNFGNTPVSKPGATVFALPTNPTTTSATGFQFSAASGDTKNQKPTSSAFTSLTQVKPTGTLGGQGTTAAFPTGGFSFGNTKSATTTTAFVPISGSTPVTKPTTTTGLSLGVPSVTSTAAGITTTSATKLSFGLSSGSSTTTAVVTTSGTSSTIVPAATTVTSSTSIIPATGLLTFSQLEDSINKWTIDLEEQGKFFINQAKQLNAWDSLLISNGEQILNLNGSVERVKQQQQQLDQELDFVLAQQKELEELIAPLEKELWDIPVTDIDRNQMYQFSEMIDSQLKQMSEDLKEIIEHINESNRNEAASNPIAQISRILNAHMNSLQWIDRNTSQISSHLEQITKMQDSNRRNLALSNSFNHSMNM
ncbi:uncharacterized protein [Leptinotarsa decemlineata]|uniref:uncharacterized protein n=1 Tax=Leptinotarsa decemlineata TaxID=7539 RepID=UPI000C255956|nr:nuclear pore glycoprotein p62 [Leptinotarsa decemlineata]